MNISLHHKDDCHVLTVEDMETVNEINRDIITHSVMASCLMILLFVAPVLRQDRTWTYWFLFTVIVTNVTGTSGKILKELLSTSW